MSHTGGYVAVAAGPPPLGVDLEVASRTPGSRAHIRYADVLSLSESEWVADGGDFLELWVRKEALIKAGAANFAHLAAVDLIGDKRWPADAWRGLQLTGWRSPALVGACAAPRKATVSTVTGQYTELRSQWEGSDIYDATFSPALSLREVSEPGRDAQRKLS
jgi:hypothetical protein